MTYTGTTVSVLPVGGLNNGYDPVTIGDTETPDCQNIRFRNNSCVKRDGIAKFIAGAAGSSYIQNLCQLIKEAGTKFELATAAGKLYLSNGATWTDVTGAITIATGQNDLVQSAQLTDKMCFTNGTNAPWKYTGAGNASALAGAPATCFGIKAYKNYLVVGQPVGVIGKVQWSALNNAESWPAANVNTFLNQQGQKVMGFGGLGDQLYVFMDRSIHQMAYTGDAVTPFTFPTRHPSIGTVSNGGIVEVDDAIYFPSYRGIYRFDGNETRYVSSKVEATWRSINKTRFPYIQGVKNEKYNEIWWAISTGSNTTNDTVLCFDYVDQKWSIFFMPVVNCFGYYPGANPVDPIVGGVAGQVWAANSGVYSDDGTAIDAYWYTRPNALGDPTRLRQVDHVRLIATADSTAGAVFEVSCAYDLNPVSIQQNVPYSSSGDVWDTGLWDVAQWASGTNEGLDYTMRPSGHGRMFTMKVRNSQLNVGMSIAAALLSFRGRRKENG